jgi:hypothetical protein
MKYNLLLLISALLCLSCSTNTKDKPKKQSIQVASITKSKPEPETNVSTETNIIETDEPVSYEEPTEKVVFNSYEKLSGAVRQWKVILYSDYTIKVFSTKWDLEFKEPENSILESEYYPIRHEIKSNGDIYVTCATTYREADKMNHQYTAIFSVEESFVRFNAVFGKGGSDKAFSNLNYISFPSGDSRFEGVGYVKNEL